MIAGNEILTMDIRRGLGNRLHGDRPASLGCFARLRADSENRPGRNRPVMSRSRRRATAARIPGSERAAPFGAALTGPAGIEPATPGFGGEPPKPSQDPPTP